MWSEVSSLQSYVSKSKFGFRTFAPPLMVRDPIKSSLHSNKQAKSSELEWRHTSTTSYLFRSLLETLVSGRQHLHPPAIQPLSFGHRQSSFIATSWPSRHHEALLDTPSCGCESNTCTPLLHLLAFCGFVRVIAGWEKPTNQWLERSTTHYPVQPAGTNVALNGRLREDVYESL